jgi:hypothetical protein
MCCGSDHQKIVQVENDSEAQGCLVCAVGGFRASRSVDMRENKDGYGGGHGDIITRQDSGLSGGVPCGCVVLGREVLRPRWRKSSTLDHQCSSRGEGPWVCTL